MKSQKAAIDPWMTTIIVLILILVFAVLVIEYYASTGKNVTEVISTKLLSRANLESIPLPQIIKSKIASGKVFDAAILITPEPPACEGEALEFSALNSKIPAGLYFVTPGGDGVICKWDLDTEFDSSGNGVKDDDVDSTDCVSSTDKASYKVNGTEVKLTLQITGNVENSGDVRQTTAKVYITIPCACATSLCLSKLTGVVGQYIKDNTITTLELSRNIKVEGVHITTTVEVHPASDFNVRLDVGDDGVSDWCGVLHSGDNALTIADPSSSACPNGLTDSINTYLASCKTETCKIPIRWYTAADLKITGVHIPYTIKII